MSDRRLLIICAGLQIRSEHFSHTTSQLCPQQHLLGSLKYPKPGPQAKWQVRLCGWISGTGVLKIPAILPHRPQEILMHGDSQQPLSG